MNEIKFCKDCKYYRFVEENKFSDQKHVCLYDNKRIDYITGESFEIEQYCHIMRESENKCGKDANFFVPKE